MIKLLYLAIGTICGIGLGTIIGEKLEQLKFIKFIKSEVL